MADTKGPTTAEVRGLVDAANAADDSHPFIVQVRAIGRKALMRAALPLAEERDALAADLARLSDEMGLPPGIGPADGELRRLLAEGRKAMAERDAERARADALAAEVARLCSVADGARQAWADMGARADAAEAEVGRMREVARRAAAAAEALEDLVDSSRGYTGDSIEWESDSTLGPKWQAWRNWAYDAIKAAKGESQ